MAAIGPIQGITPATQPPQVNKTGQNKLGEGNFGEALKSMIDKVDGDQQSSATAIGNLINGKSEDVLPVIQAVAKADLSFKLLMGVRNKVIEAYKQTMQMQV
jgi:flagellar hook-basal body complex protein FliE